MVTKTEITPAGNSGLAKYRHKPLYYNSTFVQGGTSPSHKTLPAMRDQMNKQNLNDIFMATNVFDKVFIKYLNSEKSAVTDFIRESFRQSKSRTYEDFLDDFLFKRGIISFNSIPCEKGNKFIPYLNCVEKNLFGEKHGYTDLLNEPKSLNDCNKAIAEYIVYRLKDTTLDRIKNWEN